MDEGSALALVLAALALGLSVAAILLVLKGFTGAKTVRVKETENGFMVIET